MPAPKFVECPDCQHKIKVPLTSTTKEMNLVYLHCSNCGKHLTSGILKKLQVNEEEEKPMKVFSLIVNGDFYDSPETIEVIVAGQTIKLGKWDRREGGVEYIPGLICKICSEHTQGRGFRGMCKACAEQDRD